MEHKSKNSFASRSQLDAGGKSYEYFSLPATYKAMNQDLSRLPYSLKILLENLLRHEDGASVKADDISAFVDWYISKTSDREIAFRPARVLMQDFTGVPAVVDLAAMRDAMQKLGGAAEKINPLSPVDLVIDHSVMVDNYATPDAFAKNVDLEMQRNGERYAFLRWGQKAFDNFRVVPPGTGICHQVNLEYLAQGVWVDNGVAYPDTLVGTDSHTTMINGLGVLGWGVGGIEAEAAMLGQPVSMLIPEVIGFKLVGKLREGTTATDLVLTITQMLRKKGVVGKFVEFYGDGLDHLPLANRATIANMAPEYGATCGIFPIDAETINYLKLTGRAPDRVALVESYARAQGLWRDKNYKEPVFTDTLELDVGTVEACLAGPKRPQDKVLLSAAHTSFTEALPDLDKDKKTPAGKRIQVGKFGMGHGDIVVAAITSCTNTSNPYVMMAAGLVARKAAARGLRPRPWVKTSLAPGSKIVTEYFAASGLQKDLDAIGFNLVGYGCTTCIGNSGPLKDEIEMAIKDNGLVVAAVLSGNRNFEGRIHPLVKANYLASPPLVVAYALAGSMNIDITKEPLGTGSDGKPVYLKDIWPSNAEVAKIVQECVTAEMFRRKYADVFAGEKAWQAIDAGTGKTYSWQGKSTYVQNPPYFEAMSKGATDGSHDIVNARILAIFGDSITTDHISPAGNIAKSSPAGQYLIEHGVDPADFNSYGARRGNHQVMMRGTFANIRIKNEMLPGVEGGFTKSIPGGEQMSIYDAAMKYKAQRTRLVVIAGKEYGTGSSRDWAAKGTRLLGVEAVIAESFERIHRSNLVGMGVLPLTFHGEQTRKTLALTGEETITLKGLAEGIKPRMKVDMQITYKDGTAKTVPLLCRIDTLDELNYYKNGGILQYVMKNLLKTG
ncbi:MAG: aconitate hydratase AcnA [Pseudomonadota bacterium]|nr:aconitate hydratase AcnA [Pseudomonadota bacterium]MDE3038136.1 aconitate hydratase AcnA [Pseudomonadota bacterium]